MLVLLKLSLRLLAGAQLHNEIQAFTCEVNAFHLVILL